MCIIGGNIFKKRQHIAPWPAVAGLYWEYLVVAYFSHGQKRAGDKVSCFADSESTRIYSRTAVKAVRVASKLRRIDHKLPIIIIITTARSFEIARYFQK